MVRLDACVCVVQRREVSRGALVVSTVSSYTCKDENPMRKLCAVQEAQYPPKAAFLGAAVASFYLGEDVHRMFRSPEIASRMLKAGFGTSRRRRNGKPDHSGCAKQMETSCLVFNA